MRECRRKGKEKDVFLHELTLLRPISTFKFLRLTSLIFVKRFCFKIKEIFLRDYFNDSLPIPFSIDYVSVIATRKLMSIAIGLRGTAVYFPSPLPPLPFLPPFPHQPCAFIILSSQLRVLIRRVE